MTDDDTRNPDSSIAIFTAESAAMAAVLASFANTLMLAFVLRASYGDPVAQPALREGVGVVTWALTASMIVLFIPAISAILARIVGGVLARVRGGEAA